MTRNLCNKELLQKTNKKDKEASLLDESKLKWKNKLVKFQFMHVNN